MRLVRALGTVLVGLAGPPMVAGLAGLFWWAGSAVAAPAAHASAPGSVVAAAPVASIGGWRWPLHPRPVVVRGFDPPAQPWLSGHRGVDLLGRAGQPVYAAGTGTVTFAGLVAGRGVVTVDHGDLRTTYEPLHVTVRVGERVSTDDVLGSLALIGGHCLPRACLHWGLLRGQQYLNPLSLVGAGPVRLLPLDGPGGTAAVDSVAGTAARPRRVGAAPPPTPSTPPARVTQPAPATMATPAETAAAAVHGSRSGAWAATAAVGGLGMAGAAAWALGRRRRC